MDRLPLPLMGRAEVRVSELRYPEASSWELAVASSLG